MISSLSAPSRLSLGTEGTAGIAGLLKACLALKHAVIPPNMHFSSLNPNVEPFYMHLRVVTSARRWPTLSDRIPRRDSVSSFGMSLIRTPVGVDALSFGRIVGVF